MKYVYPCILTREEVGGFSVVFPDIAGATQGEDLYEALYMAEDALGLMLSSAEDDGEEIPTPTPLEKIKTDGNSFVTLIKIDTDAYRKFLAEEKSSAPTEKISA